MSFAIWSIDFEVCGTEERDHRCSGRRREVHDTGITAYVNGYFSEKGKKLGDVCGTGKKSSVPAHFFQTPGFFFLARPPEDDCAFLQVAVYTCNESGIALKGPSFEI